MEMLKHTELGTLTHSVHVYSSLGSFASIVTVSLLLAMFTICLFNSCDRFTDASYFYI